MSLNKNKITNFFLFAVYRKFNRSFTEKKNVLNFNKYLFENVN